MTEDSSWPASQNHTILPLEELQGELFKEIRTDGRASALHFPEGTSQLLQTDRELLGSEPLNHKVRAHKLEEIMKLFHILQSCNVQ